MPIHYDAIIIGAGLSGLTAAYKLSSTSNSVLILEASDRVGGRTNTIQVENGPCVDLGGTFVAPMHVKLKNIIDQLKLKLIDQYDTGKTIMIVSKDKRLEYTKNAPELSFLPMLDFKYHIRNLERKAGKVTVTNPKSTDNSELWDSFSLEYWKQDHMWTDVAKGSLDQICRSLLGCEPCEISFLYFLFFLKSNYGLDERFHDLAGLSMLENKNSDAKVKRIMHGASTICESIVEKIGSTNVLLQKSVIQIDYEENRSAIVHTLDKNKKLEKFKATSVILAIPPVLIKNITFSPELPIEKATLLNRIYCGSITICIVFYETTFWRDQGYSGKVVCTDNSKDFPITSIHDCTDDNGKYPALSVCIASVSAIQFSKLIISKQEDKIIDSLVHIFGEDASTPTKIVIKEWATDPWARGGPVALLPPGTFNTYGTTLRAPVQQIFWAGTESASFGMGYMEGAVEAGERAAREVQNFLALQLLDSF